MRAFQVYLNEELLCTAGIGDDGVLNAMITHVNGYGHGHNELSLRVGGLNSQKKEHVIWKSLDLKTGDEVRVRITDSDTIDEPEEKIPQA
jgi:hypothetical protein